MSNALNYRQYAADCMRQAHNENTPDGHNVMLNIALAWLRLAQQAEEMAAAAMLPALPPPDRFTLHAN